MTYLAAETVGEPAVNIAIFLLFVALTLVIVCRASRNNQTAADYYAARPLLHRAAERHRHLRRLPVGRVVPRHRRRHRDQRVRRLPLLDRLPRRLAGRAAARRRAAAQHRPVHDGRRAVVPDAAAPGADGRRDHRRSPSRSSTCWPRWPAPAGWSRCCSASTRKAGQSAVIAVVGILMIIYVLVGGMKGTTWVQIVKAALLITGAGVMTFWVLAKYGFNLSSLLGDAVDKRQLEVARPGQAVRHQRTGPRSTSSRCRWRWCSAPPGLPHVLMRFYTVPTAKEARRSVVWAIWLIGIFYLFTLVLGYGAAALVGPETIAAAPGKAQLGRTAARLRARRHDPARHHRGGRLRHDPRGRRRAHHHGGRVVRARHLRQRASSRAGDAGGSEVRVARSHGGRHRHRRDPRRHPRQRAEHRLPGGAGLRRRRVGQPADDPLLAVLEAVQHPRRAVEHLRRPDQLRDADHLLAGRVREAGRPGRPGRACR